jgi:hypothetical protein
MADELRYLREDMTRLEDRVASNHQFLKEKLEQETGKMELRADKNESIGADALARSA